MSPKRELTNASAAVWRFNVRDRITGKVVSRHRRLLGAQIRLASLRRRIGDRWQIVPVDAGVVCPRCNGKGYVARVF